MQTIIVNVGRITCPCCKDSFGVASVSGGASSGRSVWWRCRCRLQAAWTSAFPPPTARAAARPPPRQSGVVSESPLCCGLNVFPGSCWESASPPARQSGVVSKALSAVDSMSSQGVAGKVQALLRGNQVHGPMSLCLAGEVQTKPLRPSGAQFSVLLVTCWRSANPPLHPGCARERHLCRGLKCPPSD
eukprot:1158975-Pelagomonas_calceolata.AAC.14